MIALAILLATVILAVSIGGAIRILTEQNAKPKSRLSRRRT